MEYFVSTVFSPAVTLVVLSWCCFWISRHAVPARVSLGITTILTAIVLFGSVNETMPPVSYSKAQDYFLLVSFGFIFVSFLEFVIVLHTDPDPGWLRWLRSCCQANSNKVFIITPSYKLQHIQANRPIYKMLRECKWVFFMPLTLLYLIVLLKYVDHRSSTSARHITLFCASFHVRCSSPPTLPFSCVSGCAVVPLSFASLVGSTLVPSWLHVLWPPQRVANPTRSSLSYLFLHRSLPCLSSKLLMKYSPC